jgi:putative endonuclease
MYAVYVLKDVRGKLYRGMTNDIDRRLREHVYGKTRTTSRMEGLSLVYFETFDNFDEARKRELYFKSAAGRRFLKKKIGPLA